MSIETDTVVWLADSVLAMHVAFILFVVGGQILILAGWALGWSWPRHRWFRLLHLLAIGIVLLQAWIGVICPLTTLENFFRDAADIATYENGFIRHWMRELVFYTAPGWVFTLIYTVFAGLVVLTWFVYPPRRKL
jgi:polyferredoxin